MTNPSIINAKLLLNKSVKVWNLVQIVYDKIFTENMEHPNIPLCLSKRKE